MSPWNLILTSLLIVLVTAAWTAPVEEREEVEPSEEADGEQSEEDEGPAGAHQSATWGASGVRPHPDVSGAQGAPVAAGESGGHADTSTDSDAVDTRLNADGEKPLNGVGGDKDVTGTLTSLEGAAFHPEYADEERSTESDVTERQGERASDRWLGTPATERAHRDDLTSSSSSSSHHAGNGRQTRPLDQDGVTAQPGQPSVELHTQQLSERTRPAATAPVLLSTLPQETSRPQEHSTESSVLVRTGPAGGAFADTLPSGTLAWRTEAVTMATHSLFSEPTGTSLDSSGGRVSEDPHKAGSVTEQYDAWGQGPEAAENVELEETC
ncbi:uncharacterized protein si:ch211-80h18.1 isoform X2 [Syngnathus acus]|uniref:uncharacterized protein si:ch211-80h18.1 isoform X2 n=1 Tax=Syngnathus acus TaxID=161584 RepID=UPI001885C490|nr:uncharacterized protein si:ch211-80h18.1 isoform X2 [Syngnathus acus]